MKTLPRILLIVAAACLALPGAADAKRKNYEGKLYDGLTIEEYCSDLLGVESFDLTDDDLDQCDQRYEEEMEDLGDVDLGDISLDGAPSTGSDDGEETVEAKEERLSRKEQEEARLAAEQAEQERLESLGLVDFGEAMDEESAEGDEEEDDLDEGLDEDLGDGGFDEDVEPIDDTDEVFIDDFEGGGSGSSLENLDDEFGEESSNTGRKKKKKKKKKGSSSTSADLDHLGQIP